MNKMIETLLEEREGYVRRGKKDRVKAVDDALAALGYKSERSSSTVETAALQAADETASIRRAAPRRKA